MQTISNFNKIVERKANYPDLIFWYVKTDLQIFRDFLSELLIRPKRV